MRTLTVTEATKALNFNSSDFVYRLLRSGGLRGAKRDDGTWEVDAASVDERIRRVAVKRSSKSNAAAERERRRAEARTRFTAPKLSKADAVALYEGTS